ncbi:MAG: DUF2946 family protein [Gammaproteobacteria bacterium]
MRAFRTQSPWRRWITLLCLLACTAQSFVAQTHIHGHSQRVTTALVAASGHVETAANAGTSRPDAPLHSGRDNDAKCPLCQIVLHGGAAPLSAYAVSLPLLSAGIVAIAEQVPLSSIAAVSYFWQSRGPPRA